MDAKSTNAVIRRLTRASREEEVIAQYQQMLGAKEWLRPFGSDGFWDSTLFEFKYDWVLEHESARALAQLCCYLRRFYEVGIYKGVHYPMPQRVAVCDKNEAFTLPTRRLERYYTNGYAWEQPPSSPDPALIKDLEAIRCFPRDMATVEGIEQFLVDVTSGEDAVSQRITLKNFAYVFHVWKEKFGQSLSPQQAAQAYLLDLQGRVSVNESKGKLTFEVGEENGRSSGFTVQASVPLYRAFWSSFELPPDNATMSAILARKDRLVAMHARRTTGEFFTPEDLAAKAHEYLLEAFPDAYQHNWWNMCFGGGNLLLDCPAMPGRLWGSTLNREDVDSVRDSGLHPEAVFFSYDFLNQDEDDLPESLRAAMRKGGVWTVLINPPYAAGTANDGELRRGMSNTSTGSRMEQLKLGHACQNLYAQFMWQLAELAEEHGLKLRLGVFTMSTWTTGTGFDKFRAAWLDRFAPRGGFVSHCNSFHMATGAWPVAYTIWESK